MNAHQLGEERSLEYHRAVALRLGAEPSLVDEARACLERWRANSGRATEALDQWRAILDGPLEDLTRLLVDPGTMRGRFANLLPSPERSLPGNDGASGARCAIVIRRFDEPRPARAHHPSRRRGRG